MNIPPSLQNILDTLPSQESEELTQIVSGLALGDAEMQDLLQSNLDALTQILTSEAED
ncbi:MAG: hypothetical protein WBA57_17010 [Elainellaceae cyanobacterium]